MENIMNLQYQQTQEQEEKQQEIEQINQQISQVNETLVEKDQQVVSLQQQLETTQTELKKYQEPNLIRSQIEFTQILNLENKKNKEEEQKQQEQIQQVETPTKQRRLSINDLAASNIISTFLQSTKQQEESIIEQPDLQTSKINEILSPDIESIKQKQDQIIEHYQKQIDITQQQLIQNEKTLQIYEQKIQQVNSSLKTLILQFRDQGYEQQYSESQTEQQQEPIDEIRDNIVEMQYIIRDITEKQETKQKTIKIQDETRINELKDELDKIQRQLEDKTRQYNSMRLQQEDLETSIRIEEERRFKIQLQMKNNTILQLTEKNNTIEAEKNKILEQLEAALKEIEFYKKRGGKRSQYIFNTPTEDIFLSSRLSKN